MPRTFSRLVDVIGIELAYVREELPVRAQPICKRYEATKEVLEIWA